MDDRLGISWGRAKALPWIKIGLGAALALLLVGVVPPFRRAATAATSKVVLWAASPFAPSIAGFEDLPQSSRVLAADGTEVGRLGSEERQLVRLAEVPPHVTRAVLAAEDAEFYHHSGVDPAAVVRALFNSVQGRVQGGSTITQQLAKLNYTGSRRTAFRKLKEVLYAAELENRYSKDELLERYLNQVYFGSGSYGIGVASSTFFGVAAPQLTVAQGATLAGKIRAPERLDPYRRPGDVQARRDQVLAAMRRHGWLGQPEHDEAVATPLQVAAERAASPGAKAPHFTDFVGREGARLDELGGTPESRGKQLFTGGYTIETTLDVKALDAAAAAVKQHLGARGDPTTAIASVQPGDGAVRVLFGGLDANRKFDVTSQGRRQPGSSFKPFVYLAMLEKGVDPRSQFDSGSPKTVDCRGAPWTVRNYEGEGGGASTVDDGMVHSINTVFAQVMAKVGPTAVQRTAEAAGIPRDDVTPPECAMALGGLREGVSPLSQAASFATFAAKGVRAEPYAIVRVRNRRGSVVYQHRTKTTQALDQTQVGVLNAALQGVVARGTGTAASIGRPLAGKTGTTENYGNAWFIGYVPQLATAVWVGHPEGDVAMTGVHGVNVAGGTFPARIFSRYMRAALANVPVQELFTASADQLNLRPPAAPPQAPRSTSPPTSAVPSTLTTLPLPPPLTSPPAPTTPTFVPRPLPTVGRQPRETTTTTTPSVTVVGDRRGRGDRGRDEAAPPPAALPDG